MNALLLFLVQWFGSFGATFGVTTSTGVSVREPGVTFAAVPPGPEAAGHVVVRDEDDLQISNGF